MIFGSAAAAGGWQENPEVTSWAVGGTFNVVKNGEAIFWRDVTFWPGGVDLIGDQYWQADHLAPCPTNYPWPRAYNYGFDLSPFLGWDDPDWHDIFVICFPLAD